MVEQIKLVELDKAKHEKDVQKILEASPTYHLRVHKVPASPFEAEKLFSTLPPEKTQDNKKVFGIFDGDQMLGCIDLVKGYPKSSTCFIGLLLIREDAQRKGLGLQSYLLLEDKIREWKEITTLRLAVVETNAEVENFWEKMGFKFTGERKPCQEDANIACALYEKKIRPAFIKNFLEIQGKDDSHYPDSDELLGISSDFGRRLGLKRMGVGLDVLPPGRRSSWPHAHSHEEEFVFVVSGKPKVWIDGRIQELEPGDGIAFPSGTGIAHTFINDSQDDVKLLVVGEQNNPDDTCYYPLHPKRNSEIPYLWKDAPKRELGSHNGKPESSTANQNRFQKIVGDMPSVLVILGSARKESNTLKAVKELCPFENYSLLDLREYELEHYQYETEERKADDFNHVIKKIESAQVVVFATPVYWYSMSGRMKVLFDRFTEFLSTHKSVGKRMAGKRIYLIACGTDPVLPEGFETPFKLTAEYFGIEYLGAAYKQIK